MAKIVARRGRIQIWKTNLTDVQGRFMKLPNCRDLLTNNPVVIARHYYLIRNYF